MMKHVVILAHPGHSSFNASVAKAYCEAVAAVGHEVKLRDLYAMDFDPRLRESELPFGADFQPAEDVKLERAIIAGADVYALIYPLWLNTPPAILKGYLERVFGFGFAYGKDGHGSSPLLTGGKLISFSSSGAPLYWLKDSGAFDAIQVLFDKHFASMCGLALVDHVHFGGIVPGIRADAVARMLESVKQLVATKFSTLKKETST
jgi:NAD(P)H dehydrogenase (quinone)